MSFQWSDISPSVIEGTLKSIQSAYYKGDDDMVAAPVMEKPDTKSVPTTEPVGPNLIDYFHPTLRESTAPLEITAEQDMLIEGAIKAASSDSQFAKKLYDAIKLILAGGVLAGANRVNPTETKQDQAPATQSTHKSMK